MPEPFYGILKNTDTLATMRRMAGVVMNELEPDDVNTIVQASFDAHNKQTAEQLGTLCDFTSERFKSYGGGGFKVMEEHDELGQSQSQKGSSSAVSGLPLRRYGANLGWTNDYLTMTTVPAFAREVTTIFDADVSNISLQVRRAFYVPTNYTFIDRLIDKASLPVKRLANGDGDILPLGPDGQYFDGATHNHYLARAGGAFAQSDLAGLVSHVTEHVKEGTAVIVIETSQETAIRGFSDFIAYLYDGVNPGDNAVQATNGKRITMFNTYNRAIGIWRGVEVWIKPWAVAGYVLCYLATGAKALTVRIRGVDTFTGGVGATLKSIINGGSAKSGIGDLQLIYKYGTGLTNADEYRREFGVGAGNRLGAAVLYVGGTTYASPAGL